MVVIIFGLVPEYATKLVNTKDLIFKFNQSNQLLIDEELTYNSLTIK